MRLKMRLLLLFGVLGFFFSTVSGDAILAGEDCPHATMDITRLGEYREYTQDATRYCFDKYYSYHAYCSTCGYEYYYHEPSYYAVGHNWRTVVVEEGSDYIITRQYCTNGGCHCDTGNMITVKKVPVDVELQ